MAEKENHLTGSITLSNPLLTVRQIMATLGVSRATAYAWLSEGRVERITRAREVF